MTHVHNDPYHPHRYTTLARNFGEDVARRIAARRVQERRCVFCGQRVEHGPALVCKTCRAAGWRYCGDCQRVIPVMLYTDTGVCVTCRRLRYYKNTLPLYTRPTAVEKRRITTLYRAGTSIAEIKRVTGRNTATIYRIVRQSETQLRQRSSEHIDPMEVARQYCEGMTIKALCATYNIDSATVYRLLTKAGVSFRRRRTKNGQASPTDA